MASFLRYVSAKASASASAASELFASTFDKHAGSKHAANYVPYVTDTAPASPRGIMNLLVWRGARSASYRIVVAGYVLMEWGNAISGVVDGSKSYVQVLETWHRALLLEPVVEAYAERIAGQDAKARNTLLNVLKREVDKGEYDSVLHFVMATGLVDYLDVAARDEHGNICAIHDSAGNCALHLAVLNGQRDLLEELVQKLARLNDMQRSGRFADSVNLEGNTALHLAALADDRQVLVALLGIGADAQLRNAAGLNTVALALEAGSVSCIRELVRRSIAGVEALNWALADLAAVCDPQTQLNKTKRKKKLYDGERSVCTLLQLGAPFAAEHVEQVARMGNAHLLKAMIVFGPLTLSASATYLPAVEVLLSLVSQPSASAERFAACLGVFVSAGLLPPSLRLPGNPEEDAASAVLRCAGLAQPRQVAWNENGRQARMMRLATGSTNALCFDGGGIRGLLLVQQTRELLRLCRQEARSPHLTLLDLFDVLCGTSTGGILAIGLARARLDLDTIQRLYFDFAADVFGTRAPPYSGEKLDAIIHAVMGRDVPLAQEGPRVFVVSTDATVLPPTTFVFRSYRPAASADVQDDADADAEPLDFAGTSVASVRDAIRATGAAPMFFPAFSYEEPGAAARTMTDGAVLHNNPSMVALIETRDLNVNCFVNIGTGTPHAKDQHFGVDDLSPQFVPQFMHAAGSALASMAAALATGHLSADAKATGNVLNLVLAATVACNETQLIEHACLLQQACFMRFNPRVEKGLLDESDLVILSSLMWETACYLHEQEPRLRATARALLASKGLLPT